jgi:predicted RNase H-like HicB family nuclease
MTGWRDTRPANWAKTVRRLRRNAEELITYGFKVVEPEDLEIPAHQRIAEPLADL